MTHPISPYLTTKELAQLLRLGERKVYDLASSEQVPCVRAGGKLLFARDAVEAWLQQTYSGPTLDSALDLPSIIAGSHDPLLDWALRQSGSGLAGALLLQPSLEEVRQKIFVLGVAGGQGSEQRQHSKH